jgi:hypothetical protein
MVYRSIRGRRYCADGGGSAFTPNEYDAAQGRGRDPTIHEARAIRDAEMRDAGDPLSSRFNRRSGRQA